MRAFPEVFSLNSLTGARGRQFQRREDAFQQLVGESLRELAGGPGVHVSPTSGRDGSIDILVERSIADGQHCLPAVPKPLIVECKDHDETGIDLRKKLFAGWRIVAKRLALQAEQGWLGNYEPWRSARSYIYAVSARFSPAQLRLELRDAIVDFFADLPMRPPIEMVLVLDWSDLRALFDSTPRLADRWLGVGLETLLGHAEQLEHFAGFRSYLVERNVSFLAPATEDPIHPDQLLARLSEPERERGILLEGPGGVGKSRTLIEVAERANTLGWRVLHAQSGEPALRDDDLESTVLAGSTPTMIILDYLDQMRLDLARLRQRLLPAAAARDIRLSFLASARPGTVRHDQLFDVVPIHPTPEHAKAIAYRLLSTVAPLALRQLGQKRLADLCGSRPILVLFIAREIERRIRVGTLEDGRLAEMRSGALSSWLQRRLMEDSLLVPPAANRLEPSRPTAHLLGAAALLAAAPQSRSGLKAVGEATLRAAGLERSLDPGEASSRLIGILVEMGWLETRDGDLATAHDVVADEVTYDVLTDRLAGSIRKVEFDAILASAFGSARTLGRLAVSLRRLVRMEGVAANTATLLTAASTSWLARESEALGPQLRRGDADEVSFALGAVIHGEPWMETALANWDTLVAPFLTARAEHPSARHLLYRGLSRLPDGLGRPLFPIAFRWLQRNGLLIDANFVLGPLLRRTDLEANEMLLTVAYAKTWLTSHRERDEAQYLLAPLLERHDLQLADVRDVKADTFFWLNRFDSRIQARFVLSALLVRRDLDPAEVRSAISHTLAWLENFGTTVGASFPLARLLSRTDLNSDEKPIALMRVFAWLESVGAVLAARFVLPPLLGRADLQPTEVKTAVAFTLEWLKEFGEIPDAEFVLERLVARRDLSARDITSGQLFAAHWVQSQPAEVKSSFLLKRLLIQKNLTPEVVHALIDAGVVWFEKNSSHPQADFVFTKILRKPELEGQRRLLLLRLGIKWLRDTPHGEDRNFSLENLLLSAALLTDDERKYLVNDAFDWLALTSRDGHSVESLKSILRRTIAQYPHEFQFAPTTILGPANSLGFLSLADELAELARDDESVPDPVWLQAVLDEIEEQFAGEHPASTGYPIQFALPLAARLDDQAVLERTRSIASRFWSMAALTQRNRDGFARACYRYLDNGAWPDPVSGERILTSIGIVRPITLADELIALIEDSKRVPDRDWMNLVLDEIHEQLNGDHPASTSYAIQAVLPLAARFDDQAVLERTRNIASRFWSMAALTQRNRDGFARACYRYLDNGAWPDPVSGERILTSIGIVRPFTLADELIVLIEDSERVPDQDWMNSVLDEIHEQLDGDYPASTSYAIQAVLPLAARLDDESMLERTRNIASRFWSMAALTQRNRDGFARACYRYLDNGAWPDPVSGERILTSIGIVRPFTLADELIVLIEDSERVPDRDWMNSVLDEIHEQLDGDYPASTSYAIQAVLPLAARLDDESMLERTRNIASRFWSMAALTQRNRDGFARACYRYLDNGAWIDRELGERTLASIGIDRPTNLADELNALLDDSGSEVDVVWLGSILDDIVEQLDRYPASQGYVIRPILPLAARRKRDPILERAREVATLFWTAPMLTQRNRDGFARACYRDLDDGAWPDRDMGEQLLSSIGVERPPVIAGAGKALPPLLALEREVMDLAMTRNPPPSPTWLSLALQQTAKPIERGFPKAAGFVLPALLVLTARCGSTDNQRVLNEQIRALLSDSSFSARGRKRFALACFRLVDDGAWPDRDEATRILASLGIHRPSPEAIPPVAGKS